MGLKLSPVLVGRVLGNEADPILGGQPAGQGCGD